MKLVAKKRQLGQAPEIWLRQAGYVFLPNREGGQDSFARRLGRDFYPRFHVYVKAGEAGGEETVEFDLHLDQKRPGYAGYHRHNAEYDGEVVEREIDRLRNLILPI